jgi:hypothetical protein
MSRGKASCSLPHTLSLGLVPTVDLNESHRTGPGYSKLQEVLLYDVRAIWASPENEARVCTDCTESAAHAVRPAMLRANVRPQLSA